VIVGAGVVSSGVVSSGGVGGTTVGMDPNVVDTAAAFLAGCGAGALAAELAEMRVGEIPEDAVDLRRLVRELDEARSAFDRRFADGLDGAVSRLTAVVRDARAADAAPFMQGSGR
jgi:hypothetical protein